jgi:cell division septation protein DedD
MNDTNFFEPDPLRPPSVFTARWFRLLLVLLLLLVVAIVGLPYILERTGPASNQSPVSLQPPAPKPAPPSPAQVQTPAPSLPPTVGEKPPQDSAAPQTAARTLPPSSEKSPPRETSAPKMRYAVQVGAFIDAANAKRLSAMLKEEKFSVQQLTVSRPGESFQVIVAGLSAEAREKIAQLKLQGSQAGNTFTVQPTMGLKEAVSLSERLKQEGLEVKVKTVKKNIRYHVVRVGGFPDRSSADGARLELESKGITGHVVSTSRR